MSFITRKVGIKARTMKMKKVKEIKINRNKQTGSVSAPESSATDLLNKPGTATQSVKKEPVLENNLEQLAKDSRAESSSNHEDPVVKIQLELELEKDRRLRLLAEYDNYRKRTQSEYRTMLQLAGERIITQLLPILDDFNRLSKHDGETIDAEGLIPGVLLIQRKLEDTLKSEGLKPIESEGEPFNAHVHEAVAQTTDVTKPGGIVLTEVEKGYYLGEKIIRHPKVVVNNLSEGEVEASDE